MSPNLLQYLELHFYTFQATLSGYTMLLSVTDFTKEDTHISARANDKAFI